MFGRTKSLKSQFEDYFEHFLDFNSKNVENSFGKVVN